MRYSVKNHPILRGVDLAVPEGSIYGFLGPNGSGKTTTLRILLGFLARDEGELLIHGTPVARDTPRSDISYLPDVPVFDPWLTPRQYLRISAALSGISSSAREAHVDGALHRAHLAHVDTPLGGLSRGMRQRFGIAQALLHEPRVLILDEPTSALDPLSRDDMLELIDSLRGHTTVFFSTHSMSDVESVCDHAAFLYQGKIRAAGTIAELTQTYGGSSHLQASFDPAGLHPDEVQGILREAGCQDISLRPERSLHNAFTTVIRRADSHS